METASWWNPDIPFTHWHITILYELWIYLECHHYNWIPLISPTVSSSELEQVHQNRHFQILFPRSIVQAQGLQSDRVMLHFADISKVFQGSSWVKILFVRVFIMKEFKKSHWNLAVTRHRITVIEVAIAKDSPSMVVNLDEETMNSASRKRWQLICIDLDEETMNYGSR